MLSQSTSNMHAAFFGDHQSGYYRQYGAAGLGHQPPMMSAASVGGCGGGCGRRRNGGGRNGGGRRSLR